MEIKRIGMSLCTLMLRVVKCYVYPALLNSVEAWKVRHFQCEYTEEQNIFHGQKTEV